MSIYTIDKMSDIELVATVLGLRADSEACARLAGVMVSDGWLSGSPLTEVAREVGSIGNRRLARLEASVELGRRALAARASRKGIAVATPRPTSWSSRAVYRIDTCSTRSLCPGQRRCASSLALARRPRTPPVRCTGFRILSKDHSRALPIASARFSSTTH